MKNLVLFILLAIVFYSCQDDENHFTPDQHVIKNLDDSLEFIVVPQSQEKLTIWFKQQHVPLRSILMTDGNQDTLSWEIVTYNAQLGFESVTIEYSFQPKETYYLSVQSKISFDTLYNFLLPPYQHIYQGGCTYEKVMDLHGDVVEYDISPSRKTIYILDYISDNDLNGSEPFILKKYDIDAQTITTFSDTSTAAFKRAINDEEVLLASHYHNQRFLLRDSLSLRKYNLATGEQTMIDWGSNGYGRYSRVIENHLMVTNPVWTAQTYALINLEDLSKISYPITWNEYVYIGEYNWDHIYFSGNIVIPENGSQYTKDYFSRGLIGFDELKQYAFVVHYSSESENQLEVYYQDELIYQGEQDIHRGIYFSGVIQVQNNKVLFHQYFDFSKEYRLSGYYQLDLDTGELTLLQNDISPKYVDFEISSGELFSIRPEGMYKLTKN